MIAAASGGIACGILQNGVRLSNIARY